MDFMYHGNCLDGSLCVSLFCLTYQILKRQFKMSKREIVDVFQKQDISPQNIDFKPLSLSNEEELLKKEKIMKYPLINLLEENLKFIDVKLTEYEKCFETLLESNKKKHKPKSILWICDVTPPMDYVTKLS